MSDTSTIKVQKNLYGVGFSPLSIGNRGSAKPEELLANKDVGLFFINTPDNNVVSAEYIARCKEHLKSFTQRCYDDSTLGKVFKIYLDDKHVKTRINGDDNLLTNEIVVELGSTPIQAFRFSFDVDIFNVSELYMLNPEDITIKVEFSLLKNGTTRNFFIEDTLPNLNMKAFAVDMDAEPEENPEENEEILGNVYSFKINTIVFKVKEDFDPSQHAIALYDTLLALI
jgi:hypothetical protein